MAIPRLVTQKGSLYRYTLIASVARKHSYYFISCLKIHKTFVIVYQHFTCDTLDKFNFLKLLFEIWKNTVHAGSTKNRVELIAWLQP